MENSLVQYVESPITSTPLDMEKLDVPVVSTMRSHSFFWIKDIG